MHSPPDCSRMVASCGAVPHPSCRAVALPPPTPPPWISGRDGGLRMLSSTTAALGAASAIPHPPMIPTTTTTAFDCLGTASLELLQQRYWQPASRSKKFFYHHCILSVKHRETTGKVPKVLFRIILG
ncbi:hypothetical protein TNCT_605351 [Trichonephila clavata]|uniref:Uncharacterized protein n=1 Tax=Trichonephila clavata TaxID=2740835 RepID=A0A8X6L4R6_TRICU|nr:hypothetical protein TNCT_605351 [Trichonephila clavata]